MRNIYFTPGPSELYPTVALHMRRAERDQIPSISHRSSQFEKIFKETTDHLRKLFRIPESFHIFFTGSSLESMERIIQNCVGKGVSCHLVNGHFSDEFYRIALQLKKNAYKNQVPEGRGFDLSKINIPKKTEIICITHNETSTGVSVPMADIYSLRKLYPHSLMVVDIVSSAPVVDVDFSKIDIAFFSVQKGFGLPAGLGVMIVSNRCVLKSSLLEKSNYVVGSYHSFLSFLEKEKKYQTPETPNVQNIFLLGEVARDMLSVGLEKIRKETRKKSSLIYSHFDRHKKYRPFVEEVKFRSQTTLTIAVGKDANFIVKKLKKLGFIVGAGYGKYKETQIRIANFPAHTIKDLKRMLEII